VHRATAQALIAAGLALSLALCGCRGKSLRVLCLAGTPGEQLLRDRLARAHQSAGPRIQYEIANSRDELILAARRRPAPDAIWASDAALAEVDRVAALEDLAPRLRTAGQEQAFAQPALDLCRSGARLRALPIDIFVAALYFNQELFTQGQVPVPRGDWTWSQYLAAAKRLTLDTNGDGVPDIYGVCRLSELQAMLLQAGVRTFDESLTRCIIAQQPEVAQALNFYLDLDRAHHVAYPSAGYDVVQVFGAGRAAMFVGSSRWVAELSRMTDLEWAASPAPSDRPNQGAVPMGAICIAIPKGAKQPEEAWRFALFCASREGQQAGGEALAGAVPAQTAAATLPVFNPAQPTGFAALVQGAYQSKGLPTTWARSYLDREVWSKELDGLLAGTQTVEQTLANLQAAGERILKMDLAQAAAAATRQRR